jgi:meso-butanediol dehydrogenase/(S,S)-butanediol dehydrogenase/diacetyl reductase
MTSPIRAAIVTGSGQGLGRAIALRLAQDGYDIALNDLASNVTALESLAEEIKAKGRKAITVIGDVGQEVAVQTLVDRTVAELGELYVVGSLILSERSLNHDGKQMVANAGIGNPPANVVDSS